MYNKSIESTPIKILSIVVKENWNTKLLFVVDLALEMF